MKLIGYLLEIAGLGLAVGGLYLLAPWLGLFALGLAFVLVGIIIGDER